MRPIIVVAFNTTKEILRNRVLYGLVIFAFFLILSSLLMGGLTYTEQGRIITDIGLGAAQIGCCMLAVFVGGSLVWREIEKQTVLLLISKPVRRSEFLLGKFLGLSLVLILVDALLSLLLGGVCRFYGLVYWQQFCYAQLGTLLESLFLLSVGIFFGTFCGPIITVLFTLSIWFMGHGMNDLRYFSGRSSAPLFKFFGTHLPQVFPNLDFFNFKEAVIYGDLITNVQVLQAIGLFGAWFGLLLISSVWIFGRRDFI